MSAQQAPLPRKKLLPEAPDLRVLPGGGDQPRKTGTKCSPELTAQFCELIKKGLPPDAVCDFLGISSSSFWKWLRRGEIYNASGRRSRNDLDAPYGAFVSAFRKAFAEYRLERIERLHQVGNKNWYRELAILERRDRKSFGRQEQPGGEMTDYSPDESFL